jgi:AraC family transcriptional regulator of adaptative response / DNA-3-methyladenine glycosylase II
VDEGRYMALCTRDARFDGRFFTGVTSTGIYCRPVCAVRTPKRENCRFFDLAAQAEKAGFRPCLRCRPEVSPASLVWSTQDASHLLVHHALRLLNAPDALQTAKPLAERLGVSDRHLRRLFEAQLGLSPLQYLQTRRLLTAKQLLTDTALPVTQVALSSGFGSVRRFNAAFAQHYGLSPTALRRSGTVPGEGATGTLRLGYRPPLDARALLAFFGKRQFHGVEWAEPDGPTPCLRRTVRWQPQGGPDATGVGTPITGWLQAQFDLPRHQVLLQTSDSLYPVLPAVIQRVRALLDLDADPSAINAVLHADFPQGDGLRVPGAWDGLELAVRAVMGQQITVAAARTLGQRLVECFGEPISTPWPQLSRLFPTAAVLARADGPALGQLGIVRQRQAAIVALARLPGQLVLDSTADVQATTQALCALPGIGGWTAQYIAMRVLRWPDAFVAGDVALHKALGVQGHKQPGKAATEASLRWQPWRSYAVVRAWAGLEAPGLASIPPTPLPPTPAPPTLVPTACAPQPGNSLSKQ